MKPRSLRLIVIAGIAAVSLGSSLLISSGNAPGDRRATGMGTESATGPAKGGSGSSHRFESTAPAAQTL